MDSFLRNYQKIDTTESEISPLFIPYILLYVKNMTPTLPIMPLPLSDITRGSISKLRPASARATKRFILLFQKCSSTPQDL